MWNLLCQYNNINVSLHQYLKGKKKHKPTTEKKKKDSWNQSTVEAIVHGQCKNTGCTVSKHCVRIGAFIIKKLYQIMTQMPLIIL